MNKGWALLSRVIRKVHQDPAFWDLLDETVGSGPFDGGCLVCAKALQEVFGGEIVHIAREGSCQPEHYGVMVGGLVLDFDGPCPDPGAWMARFCGTESIGFPVVFQRGVGIPAGVADCTTTASLLARLIRRHVPRCRLAKAGGRAIMPASLWNGLAHDNHA